MNVLHLVCPVHGEQKPINHADTYGFCPLCDLVLQPHPRMETLVWSIPTLWRRGRKRGHIKVAS